MTKDMNPISSDEIKRIELLILKDVAAFCDENDIKYSLGYGSLLGAIRHKGFIPWDDDMDIVMPRPDYEKFFSLYKNRNAYKAVEATLNSDYPYAFGKVIDTNTVVKELSDHKFDLGIYIDVFPVDGLPDDERKRYLHSRKASFWGKILIWKLTKGYPVDLFHRILHKAIKLALAPFSYSWIVNKEIQIATKYPYNQGKYAEVLTTSIYHPERYPLRTYFEDLIDWPFEDTKFKVPREYHECLKLEYDDYMQLPPVEKREIGHGFTAYYR